MAGDITITSGGTTVTIPSSVATDIGNAIGKSINITPPKSDPSLPRQSFDPSSYVGGTSYTPGLDFTARLVKTQHPPIPVPGGSLVP